MMKSTLVLIVDGPRVDAQPVILRLNLHSSIGSEHSSRPNNIAED